MTSSPLNASGDFKILGAACSPSLVVLVLRQGCGWRWLDECWRRSPVSPGVRGPISRWQLSFWSIPARFPPLEGLFHHLLSRDVSVDRERPRLGAWRAGLLAERAMLPADGLKCGPWNLSKLPDQSSVGTRSFRVWICLELLQFFSGFCGDLNLGLFGLVYGLFGISLKCVIFCRLLLFFLWLAVGLSTVGLWCI